MHVAGLTLFPVKGARGVPLDEARVEARGLSGDRRWMVVDAGGRFVSQRELPALARLVAEPSEGGLTLRLDGDAIAVDRPDRPRREVVVWRDRLALPEAGDASDWLSRGFGQPLHLVYQPDDVVRPAEAAWSRTGDQTSLADAYPILIATTASLAALEAEVGAPLGMARFRPNLVIEGALPWAEDGWARIRAGAVEMDLVKPCTRCKVTTVDQSQGLVSGEEPLATLRRLRLSGDRRVNGVLFGWNAIPRRLGRIAVGDTVTVLEVQAPWPLRVPAALA